MIVVRTKWILWVRSSSEGQWRRLRGGGGLWRVFLLGICAFLLRDSTKRKTILIDWNFIDFYPCLHTAVFHIHVLQSKKIPVNGDRNNNKAFLSCFSHQFKTQIKLCLLLACIFSVEYRHTHTHTHTEYTWEHIAFFPGNITGIGQWRIIKYRNRGHQGNL